MSDMFRDFWIVNSLNQTYELSNQDTRAFFNTPSGLGFKRIYESKKVGNSEIIVSQELSLTDISGEMVFYYDNIALSYNEYQEFIKFMSYAPLTLHYKTPNELTSYHCDILFIQADKSEVSHGDSMLHVPVTFHRLTEWLTDEDKVYVLDNRPLDDGKYHNLIYDYHYAGTNLSNSVITNDGTDDIGFVLEITGRCQNPQFTLSQNGEIYGICKINGTYDYVMIDSVERSEHIYLENNGASISNPERFQDFNIRNSASYLTWCKLKVGASDFAFTCGNIDVFDGTINISFKTSFASV